METTARLEISRIEIDQLDPSDWKWTKFSTQYFVRLIKHANECGLKGRRITEVRGYEMLGRDDIRYIDFLCEDT